ncbi:MAG TPA: hypothetical protein VJ963_15645 [Bacteroidales bacterium]|nr:hypothetical protein [Bacteroidales bacterium]
MKKIFVLLQLIVLLSGCVGNNRNLQEKLLDNKINEGLKSGIRYDSVLLGLRLGDSLKMINEKLRVLVEKKDLNINSSGQYEYTYSFSGPGNSVVEAQATLKQNYYGDRLYQLTLRVTSTDPSISFPPVLELSLLDNYTKKYGDDYISSNTKIKEYNNYKDYCWIKGNRMTELKLTTGAVLVIFTDLITQKFLDSQAKSGRKTNPE